VMTSLLQDGDMRADAYEVARAYQVLGVERLVCAVSYNTTDEYRQQVEQLADLAARLAA